MYTTTTITITSAQARSHAGRTRAACWCGQDLEHVERTHCPRCGRSRSRWSGR